MKTKAIIIGILIVLAIIVLFVGLSFKSAPKDSWDKMLTDDKLITNQTLGSMIINDMKSPLGNNLTRVVLDPDDPQIMDEPWADAYYVCTDNEHRGWIHAYRGNLKAGLYGPYEWCLV